MQMVLHIRQISMIAAPNRSSLRLTAGQCDDQLEFMKYIVDIAKARSRQRWLR
jgi:hypothetical protein